MKDEKDPIQSRHTSVSKLSTYNASAYQSTVRMECDGLFRAVVRVNEHSSVYELKPDHNTLLALRDVLNRWHEQEVVKRGRDD